MCIRDSRRIVRGIGRGVVSVPDRLVVEDVAADDPGHGSHPVSYTHLRAHETVLDLVCRLLLEKKKNMKHNAYATTTNRLLIRERTHIGR